MLGKECKIDLYNFCIYETPLHKMLWLREDAWLFSVLTILTVLEVTDLETEKEEKSADPSVGHMYDLDATEQGHFTSQLMSTFWKLHAAKPANPMLAPVCLPGKLSLADTLFSFLGLVAVVGSVELVHWQI